MSDTPTNDTRVILRESPTQEIARLRERLHKLLAVVHNDGGFYTEATGEDRSAQDATTAVLADRAELERLRREPSKEVIIERMSETVWLVAEAFGGRRDCPACQKVVRHMDRRELGSVCALHGRKA
jgi:hypothetical protein